MLLHPMTNGSGEGKRPKLIPMSIEHRMSNSEWQPLVLRGVVWRSVLFGGAIDVSIIWGANSVPEMPSSLSKGNCCYYCCCCCCCCCWCWCCWGENEQKGHTTPHHDVTLVPTPNGITFLVWVKIEVMLFGGFCMCESHDGVRWA